MRLLSRRKFLHLSAAASATALGCFFVPGCSVGSAGGDKDSSSDEIVSSLTDSITSSQMPLMHLETGPDGLEGIQFFAFDTICSIKAYTTPDVLEQLHDRCVFFDEHFSRQREGSDIYRINNAGGAPVEVAQETAQVISQSLAYCEDSDGLFDITIGAATELWDFAEGVVADPQALAEAIRHIDWHCVTVDGATVTLSDPAAKLDLGGVAKGYIADALADQLRSAGCAGALINLGGNVYALGSKSDGGAWNVGLQDPNEPSGAVFGKVAATDASVVTSGLYERNFTSGGVLYHHILDPKTGYPAETDLVASTILSKKSIDGDAYATILFLQGAQTAMETLESHPDLEGLVVSADGQTSQTSGFAWEKV